MAFLYLFLAGLIVNGVHGYLLATQKHGRKWSISEHAVLNRKTYVLYVAGHITAGFFFLLFGYEFLIEQFDARPLLVVVAVTVFFEYLQAIMPAKGKWYVPHTVAAVLMWVSFITFGVWSAFSLDLSPVVSTLAKVIMLSLVGAFVYTGITVNKNLWWKQMVMVLLLYAGLLIMQIG